MSNDALTDYLVEMLNAEGSQEPAAEEAPATKTPYPYETLEQKAIAEEIRKGDPNGYVDELIKYNNELLRDCE
jgi:hypothetical protein